MGYGVDARRRAESKERSQVLGEMEAEEEKEEQLKRITLQKPDVSASEEKRARRVEARLLSAPER
eukprot:2611004-Rhodomonas_salina.1